MASMQLPPNAAAQQELGQGIHILSCCRDAKDAFASVSDDEQETVTIPGRIKTGPKNKRAQQRDPGLLQAEQILQAGSHAINLCQDQSQR